jgi:hypothetical protein
MRKLLLSLAILAFCVAVVIYALSGGWGSKAGPGLPVAVEAPQADDWEPLVLVGDAGVKRIALRVSEFALSPVPIFVETDPWETNFIKGEGERGIVHPHARVATFEPYGGVPIKAAIDADDPDAKEPNLIRLDFTGEGDFTQAAVLHFAPQRESGRDWFQASFGPTNVIIQRDGVQIPVCIEGEYVRSGGFHRWCTLFLGTAVQTSLPIGDLHYPVRIIDGNSNLLFNDRSGRPGRSGLGFLSHHSADTVMIGDPVSGFGADSLRLAYGQPAHLGGSWYDIRVDGRGSGVLAEVLPLRGGKLQLAARQWEAVLENDDHYFQLSGGTEPIDLPAGSYHLLYYVEHPGADAGTERRAFLSVGHPYSRPRPDSQPTVHIRDGEVLDLLVGAPLTARITAHQRDERVLSLSLELTDRGGRRIGNVRESNGRLPDQPTIRIYDSDGNEVHSARLEYG